MRLFRCKGCENELVLADINWLQLDKKIHTFTDAKIAPIDSAGAYPFCKVCACREITKDGRVRGKKNG